MITIHRRLDTFYLNMKIIAITGSPCTGKTTLTKRLSERLPNTRVLDLHEIIDVENVSVEMDKERDTKIVDVKELKKHVSQRIKESKKQGVEHILVDGVLSHHMPATHVIVLRVKPTVLEKRLEKRGYSPGKIRENLEAEAMGVCLHETLSRNFENILEINATYGFGLRKIHAWLKSENRHVQEIDWLPDFYRILARKR